MLQELIEHFDSVAKLRNYLAAQIRNEIWRLRDTAGAEAGLDLCRQLLLVDDDVDFALVDEDKRIIYVATTSAAWCGKRDVEEFLGRWFTVAPPEAGTIEHDRMYRIVEKRIA